jgi:hypothetical protein
MVFTFICVECGQTKEKRSKNDKRCPECSKAYFKSYRKRYYHEVVKPLEDALPKFPTWRCDCGKFNPMDFSPLNRAGRAKMKDMICGKCGAKYMDLQ